MVGIYIFGIDIFPSLISFSHNREKGWYSFLRIDWNEMRETSGGWWRSYSRHSLLVVIWRPRENSSLVAQRLSHHQTKDTSCQITTSARWRRRRRRRKRKFFFFQLVCSSHDQRLELFEGRVDLISSYLLEGPNGCVYFVLFGVDSRRPIEISLLLYSQHPFINVFIIMEVSICF